MALNMTSSATCTVCSELYTDPRMLQCLHSFCSKCLKKIIKEQGSGNSLKCPKCEKMSSIPQGGINTLPMDLQKGSDAECAQYTTRIQSEEDISCDQCVDTSSGPAISFCVECCEFICKLCIRHHKFGRKTLSHELVPVGSEKAAKKDVKLLLKIPQKPTNCPLHEDETLKFFCETCSTLICRDCMAIEHSGHTYDHLEKVAEKHKGELSSTLKHACGAAASLDSALAKGVKLIQQVQCKQISVEKNIRATFKTLHDALSKREKGLLAKTAELGVGKQTALTIQGEEFSSLRKEIADACEIITPAIQSYTSAQMLSVKRSMTNRLQQLLKQYQEVDLEPCRKDVICSVLDTSELIKNLGSFGIVLGGSDPGKAKTDLHLPTAVVQQKRNTTITTYDVAGQRFAIGGERVEVTLSLMSLGDPAIKAKVLDNEDGTYVASFTPQKVGEHKLSITIDGQHIKGSPYPLYARQRNNYTSLSKKLHFKLPSYPYDVAVDDNGDVYVALYGYHCIEVYSPSGRHMRTIGSRARGSSGKREGQFNSPSAIAIRGSILYIAEWRNSRVQKLTTSGEFVYQFGNGHLKNPRGICLDKDGKVFVSSSSNNRICVFEADGTHISDILGNTSNGSNLNGPWGLAFDHSGNLHVADTNTNTIKVFTPQGQYVTCYGSGVSQPAGIVIDDEGQTFVAEHSATSRLCILDSQHQVISSLPRLVQDATGVTIDKEGSIYLCGYSNCCVFKYW